MDKTTLIKKPQYKNVLFLKNFFYSVVINFLVFGWLAVCANKQINIQTSGY